MIIIKIELIWLKKRIYLPKFALFVKNHSHGEKNGKEFGEKLSIVVKNAEETGSKWNENK